MCEAHRLVYHSTLGLRVKKKKKKHGGRRPGTRSLGNGFSVPSYGSAYRGASLIRNSAPLGPCSRTMPSVLGGS